MPIFPRPLPAPAAPQLSASPGNLHLSLYCRRCCPKYPPTSIPGNLQSSSLAPHWGRFLDCLGSTTSPSLVPFEPSTPNRAAHHLLPETPTTHIFHHRHQSRSSSSTRPGASTCSLYILRQITHLIPLLLLHLTPNHRIATSHSFSTRITQLLGYPVNDASRDHRNQHTRSHLPATQESSV